MAIEIKQRVGTSLLPVPLGCDCSGGGSGVDAGELAAIRQELAEVAGNAESASRDAASAIGLANDAAGAAESAAEVAAAAGEKAAEALSAAGSIRQAEMTLYLGGSSASDVMCDGRGLVPELPFETMTAALAWGKHRADILTCVLQGDIDDSGKVLYLDHVRAINLFSKADVTTKPTVLCKRIILTYGYLYANNIAINADSSDFGGGLYAFSNTAFVNLKKTDLSNVNSSSQANLTISSGAGGYISGGSFSGNGEADLMAYNGSNMLLEGEITLSGKYSRATLLAGINATISVYSKAVLSGNVTGKKYEVHSSSRMIFQGSTLDKLPGSLAGVCDSSSTVTAA